MSTKELPDAQKLILLEAYRKTQENYRSAADRGIKALFLLNGGGLVSVLTAYHSKTEGSGILFCALGVFLVGLVLGLAIVTIDFGVCRKILHNFTKLLEDREFSQERIKKLDPCPLLISASVWMGYISVGLFILGATLGMIGYWFHYCSL